MNRALIKKKARSDEADMVLAKAFDSVLALFLLLLLAGVCIALYASARRRESGQMRAFRAISR